MMISKKVYKYSDIKDKIVHAIDTITDPIRQTLGPKGGNVLYEDANGNQFVTNDGVTIAKHIDIEDPVENAIIQVIKHSALKTNSEVGDGPQPLWSKIATADGYKTMKDIEVGDYILGTNMSIQRVLGVFDKGLKRVCKVKFSDGRVVECSFDHLWTVTTDSGHVKTITAKEMFESGVYREKNNGSVQYKYFIPKQKANHSTKELLLDPYLVGVLLGDGSLSGSGSIEISLGDKKKHIIDKLKLPDGIIINTRYDDKKNYYRIKISGKTKDGFGINNLLEQLGLFGCLSNTKFIPSEYLYSNIEQRNSLLQGLTDTDGYTNKDGLLEYSTVSKQLADDVCELLRGLGKVATVRVHSRENDPNSYSNNSIYRITENKGCKYGNKIIDIELSETTTQMKCIKVSNSDNLYLTDGYISTHNTSTTILYSSVLVKEGFKLIADGMNQMIVRDEYLAHGKKLKEKLKKKSRKIKDDNDLLFVSKISANNDEEIAKDVVKVVGIAGQDGMVFIEPSYSKDTEIIEDSGFVIDAGILSPELITNKDRFTSTYLNVPVLVTDKRIYYAQEAETILSVCLKNGYKEVVIVAKDFIGEALPFFIANHTKGNIKVLLIKEPTADKSGTVLEDLAIYLGGKIVSEQTGSLVDKLKIEDFCMAPKVYADGVKSIIGRDKDELNRPLAMRIAALKRELKKKGSNEDEEQKSLKKRLASMTNGMVTIKVGGVTPIEVREKVFRFEDSVNAARAALKDGYLIGGGISIYNACKECKFTDEVGKVFGKMCEANIKQIAENSGAHVDSVLEMVNLGVDDNIGYNALNGTYEDLLLCGVVDPYKVTEMAIDNAISIANVILSSRYLIINEIKEDDKSN